MVVFLHRFVEILTADGDTIFRAFELSLQFREILVGLQVGIILRQSEETAKGLGEFALCRLELGQLLGRGVRRVNGNLRGFAAGSKSSAASIESMAGRWCGDRRTSFLLPPYCMLRMNALSNLAARKAIWT